MGDPTAEVTDEDRDAAQLEKGKAMEAISQGTHSFLILTFFFSSWAFVNALIGIQESSTKVLII